MNNRNRISSSMLCIARALAITAATCSIPALALAHHSMGGKLPATFLDGFISGLAHPVIGLDHLAMTLLIGAYCGITRQGLKPVLAFVIAALFGCFLHVARWDLPRAETGVAASLIVTGLVACAALRPGPAVVISVLGASGVLHGYTYGESIGGAEATPMVAYLLGLSTVQGALGTAMWRVTRPVSDEPLQPGRLMLLRLLGVATAVIGAAALG